MNGSSPPGSPRPLDDADPLDALPAAERDAAFVQALGHGFLADALPRAFARLIRHPSRVLAEAITAKLESGDFLREFGAALVIYWQTRWGSLDGQVPSRVWRPLAASALVRRAAPRPPRSLPAVSLASTPVHPRALEEEAIFQTLSRQDRLAVATSVAALLGEAFTAGPELVGDRHLPSLIHLPTGYELVLLPGGAVEVGLTDADLAAVRETFVGAEDAHLLEPWLEEQLVLCRPCRWVRVPPLAFGRTGIAQGGPLHERLMAMHGPVDPGGRGLPSFARRCGFRLPSEVEWEHAARDATQEPFVLDLARVWFGGLPRRDENAGGIADLDVGELTDDGWHASYENAPRDAAPWSAADESTVFRGFNGGYCDEDWDVARGLVALRAPARPGGGLPPRFRLVLGPTAAGEWRFPICDGVSSLATERPRET